MLEVEQRRVEYEEFIEEQSQSQGRNMQLEENQVIIIILIITIRIFIVQSHCESSLGDDSSLSATVFCQTL